MFIQHSAKYNELDNKNDCGILKKYLVRHVVHLNTICVHNFPLHIVSNSLSRDLGGGGWS